MTIKTIKDLEAVITLCRKRGVLSIEIDGIKLQLAENEPVKTKKLTSESSDKIDTDKTLTDEELMFWSSGQVNG